jgi:hypothetical protein
MAADDQVVFVQVSDCHIGRILANRDYTGAIRTTAGSGRSQPSHDVDLCKAFVGALDEVRDVTKMADEAPIRVVMSGDLTASGDPDEFAVAHSFFRSLWRLRRKDVSRFEQEAGLSLVDDEYAGVPGNHDNWYGRGWRESPSYNPNLYPFHFRETPWNKVWPSEKRTMRLFLCGIDSNSGLPDTTNRFAKGAIKDEQLKALQNGPHPDPNIVTIKAIVVHHSLAYVAPWRKMHALELEAESREALLDAAAANGFVAIMTGHTHDPHHEPFSRQVNGGTRVVHELRCASTFQVPPEDTRGFIVHRIYKDNGGYVWSTLKYVWHDGRFISEPLSARWNPFPVP